MKRVGSLGDQLASAMAAVQVSGDWYPALIDAEKSYAEQPLGMPSDLGDLRKEQLIGEGGYSLVWLVRLGPERYALKQMHKAELASRRGLGPEVAFREKAAYEEIKPHPVILRCHCCFADERNLYILLELCLMDMYELIEAHADAKGRLPPDWARFYVASIALGLRHMHGAGYVYRDLKPENVLLDRRGFVKLTDMGAAKKVDKSRTFTALGTEEYIAPEQARTHPSLVPAAARARLDPSRGTSIPIVLGTAPAHSLSRPHRFFLSPDAAGARARPDDRVRLVGARRAAVRAPDGAAAVRGRGLGRHAQEGGGVLGERRRRAAGRAKRDDAGGTPPDWQLGSQTSVTRAELRPCLLGWSAPGSPVLPHSPRRCWHRRSSGWSSRWRRSWRRGCSRGRSTSGSAARVRASSASPTTRTLLPPPLQVVMPLPLVIMHPLLSPAGTLRRSTGWRSSTSSSSRRTSPTPAAPTPTSRRRSSPRRPLGGVSPPSRPCSRWVVFPLLPSAQVEPDALVAPPLAAEHAPKFANFGPECAVAPHPTES